MKSYQYSNLSPEERDSLLRRPKIDFGTIFGTVEPILKQVELEGNKALRELTQRFDGDRKSVV